ncbi:MAG: hypothetical protein R3E98_14410 [Gemmatimonadota bacterium]|nr:hypothetical protein [Gemmatimonadota bacterium]
MDPLFRKLNLKDHDPIVVLDAPASFEAQLDALRGVHVLRAFPSDDPVEFVIAFATRLRQVEALAAALADGVRGDAIVWVAWPKKTSRRFTCEFDRDTGFSALGTAGFEGVRAVAIDEDWSALRFRRTSFIARLTRDPSRALSDEGRKRTGGQ